MKDSGIKNNFEQPAQSAQTPNEVVEQNKQDMKIDGNPPLENKSQYKHEFPAPTLEMKGAIGDAVKRKQFEEKQMKLWMENKQKSADQQLKQQASKSLQSSFFDSLSEEDRAKIEAYRQANQEENTKELSRKQTCSKGEKI